MTNAKIQRINEYFFKKNLYSFLLIVLIAAASSLVILSANIYFCVALLGIALSILSFINIKIAIWILMVNVFLISSIVGSYFPFIGRKAIWITDLMLLIMLFRFLVFVAIEKINILSEKDNIIIFTLILLGLLSAVVNGSSVVVAICGFRNYYKYLPLFFILKYFINDRQFINRIFLFWIAVAAINVPLSVYQLLAGEPLETMSQYDMVGGLFSAGGSGILSVYQLVIIGYILMLHKTGNALTKSWTVLFILFLLLPLFINETKVTFILMPLMFLYVYKDKVIKNPIEAFSMLFGGLLLLYCLNMMYERPDENFGAQKLFSKEWLNSYMYDSAYFTDEAGLNRFSAIDFAWKNIKKDPVQFFIGVGPGNASYSQLPGGMGKYYLRYEHLNIDMIFLSKILWEYGMLGTLIYMFLIFWMWKKVNELKNKTYDSGFSAAIGTFTVLTLFLTITIIYNGSFYIDELGLMFWSVCGFFRQKLLI